MQKTIKFAVTSWLLVSTLVLCAQNPQGAAPQPQNTTPQAAQSTQPQAQQTPPPVSVLLKKVVAFLTVDYQDGNEVGQVRGTAFFVALEDKRLGENRAFIYLVTNRHMAEPEKDGRKLSIRKVSLRLNLKSAVAEKQSEEGTLPLGNGLRWYFPKDDAVDLAVMPLVPDEQKYDYAAFPVSLFATQGVIESEKIAEGDAVEFAGFFYQFPGQKKIEPIVRQGILAMMPDEELETTLGKPGRLYLADVHVFHGNSGAPMFVNVGGLRGGGLTLGGFPYRLLGVVSGYFYETEDFHLQVATTLAGTANANSGISIVVPVEELKALLDSAELRQQRDAAVPKQSK